MIKTRKTGLTREDVKKLVKATSKDDPAKLAALKAKKKKWKIDEEFEWDGPCTPLQSAVGYRAAKCVRYLLEAGADPNKCRFGWTPLTQACDIHCEEIVELLLAHGANPNVVGGGSWNERGETALMGACHRGHRGIVEKLLAAGADPTLVTADGRNAISEAVNAKDREIVTMLLAAGARPLASALIPPVVRRSELLSLFSDAPDELPRDEMATCMSFIEMALSHKAAVDIRFNLGEGKIVKAKGDTLLGCAARSGDLEVVKALIAAGADVNALTFDNPPIVMAASNNYPEVVRVLFAAGADIEAVSMFGRTALATAVDKGNLECVRILRSLGADPRRRGKGQLARSALELLRENGSSPELATALS